MSEPTAAMTFRDLILHVAKKVGFAFYGDDGTEVAQIPQNVEDLQTCKDHVNRGIRMLLLDAPVTGWRCARPTAQVELWPSVATEAIATDAWVTATSYALGSKVLEAGESYVCIVAHTSGVFAADLVSAYWRETWDCTSVYEPATDTTLITASASLFYASMERKTLTVTGVGDLTIASYVSATQVRVDGDNHWVGANTFSITGDGNFTMPQTFGGNVEGDITFAAGTNTGARIEWVHEARIRQSREVVSTDTGDPRYAACRPIAGSPRRWELIMWPIPSELVTVEFPYELYFDKLTNLDDLHPFGYRFDEVLQAAVMAVAEQDTEDISAGLTQYYRETALPNAHRLDTRAAPRRLGYCGNGRQRLTQRNFREFTRRPTVTYTP